MKRFLVFFVGLALLLTGLWYADTRLAEVPLPTSTPTPLPTRAPEPTPTPAVQAGPRVVVISLDAAQAARVRGYMGDGTMPNLARLAGQGALAQYALSVDPPLRAPAHASLASGSYPAETGVVADRFHRPEDDLSRYVEAEGGFEPGADPLWRSAMREAHRTAVLFWPGVSLDAPATVADYTVTYGAVDAPSAQHEITFTQALSWTAAPRSFSPLREGTLTITKDQAPLARLYVLAVDSTNDSKDNPDTFILSRSRRVDGASAPLRLGETRPLILDDHLVSGAYFTLTRVAADKVTIFQSQVCYNRAQPNELVRGINERLGFFPAGPDSAALQRGWINPEQYIRMAEVQSRWMISVTTYVLDAFKPELLFTWQGVPGELQDQFLLLDAKQPKHTPALAAEYSWHVRRGYALADAAVGQLAGALDLRRISLFVVSGYGAAPVHTQVNLNTILSTQKLLVYDKGPGNRVNLAQSKALAVASGSAAHIYINLRNREPTGSVSPEQYSGVQDAIVAALSQVKGADGQPVFSRIVRRQSLDRLELDSPLAGDVFVQAAPGYSLTDAFGQPAVLGPAPVYGGHGFPAEQPEMQALFLAVGRGIQSGVQAGPVHIVDLTPTVSYLLGLEPAKQPAGRVLDELILQ